MGEYSVADLLGSSPARYDVYDVAGQGVSPVLTPPSADAAGANVQQPSWARLLMNWITQQGQGQGQSQGRAAPQPMQPTGKGGFIDIPKIVAMAATMGMAGMGGMMGGAAGGATGGAGGASGGMGGMGGMGNMMGGMDISSLEAGGGPQKAQQNQARFTNPNLPYTTLGRLFE
jgi:hypothetical protein